MFDEQALTKKPNEELAQGRTDFWTNTVRLPSLTCVSLRQ